MLHHPPQNPAARNHMKARAAIIANPTSIQTLRFGKDLLQDRITPIR